MKIKHILLMIVTLSFSACTAQACAACFTKSPEFVNYNKNDDKDDDPDDGNAGEPKKRDHKGRKHRGAE
jgi:hypothetical protein